ncbi:uncharacterized protein LOC131288041 [Anopheles ziemanni]|uniref:uncharacterized protein LOC131259065 n=1 Tax=Anopheles coustani TaxID=139045 RepID=UPI00265890AC|nr:uncharacterized protein LOC131259065 [Anopheles coustani]XP_058173121.1 uncharacterized protein LOC131288041 [Anopheles ziemanni]
MNLNYFPNEVLCRIFDYLSWKDRQRVSLVCCRWNDIINSEHYIRHQKLVLYNYSKARFFSGVRVELLNRQKHIELNSNAMLDTEEVLQTIGESFGGGEAMVNSLSFVLRSEHRVAFGLVLENLPNLVHLKELNISVNGALRKGVRIDSARLEKLNISFYQNSRCTLHTPNLHTLHLTVRYRSEMDLLRTISAQLVELQVSFISKDHVAKLFDCDCRSLKRLSILLRNDKYIPYSVSPVLLRPLDKDGIFARTIVGLQSLQVEDVCHIFDIDFLQMFVYAKSLKTLVINYIRLTVEVNQFINGCQQLKNLNLEGCPKADEPKELHLPALETLVVPYKHLSLFESELKLLTTLYYSNANKNQSQFVKQIAKAFPSLNFLCLQNFDNELDSNAFSNLTVLTKLRTLVIKDMSVASKIFTNCPNVPHLERLVTDTIVSEVSMLDAIPARFPALQSYVIKNCFLYLIPSESGKHHMTFDSLRRLMPHCCVSTKDSTIFTEKDGHM